MNQKELQNIPTPAYVFDLDVFRSRVQKVKEAFGEIGLCYSIKANPFLTGKTPDEITWLEVCSPGELKICIEKKIDPAKIIFSGVNKTKESIREALCYQVAIFTAESLLHARLLQDVAAEVPESGKKVPVLLRLSAGSQFGMSEEDLIRIIRDWKSGADYTNLSVIGIHFFSGTQKKKASDIEKELNDLEGFLTRLKDELGFEASHVEYGTGLGVEYFIPSKKKDAEDTQDISCDHFSMNTEKDLSLLTEVSVVLKTFASRYPLTVEMGRFFAADCGTYLTKVMDLKTTHGVNYAILDGGLNQLKYQGQTMGMQTPVIDVVKADEPHEEAKETYCLCGSLCTTSDILVRQALLPKLSLGDRLAFRKTGAYSVTEGLALFLSRELPAVYMKEGQTIKEERPVTQIFDLNL